MANRRLTFIDRVKVAELHQQNYPQQKIARKIGCDQSTVSRELNRIKKYDPEEAQVDRNQKMSRCGRKCKLKKYRALKRTVEECLIEKRWSPIQTSANLKRKSSHPNKNISHESIYRYIFSLAEKERFRWVAALRHSKGKKKRGCKKKRSKMRIPGAISIRERPGIVHEREEIGHWEGDFVIGKGHGSAIGTLVERVTRFLIIVHLPDGKTSEKAVKAFAKAFLKLPKRLRKSLTYDNGSEMADHKTLKELTKMDVYFADPGSPWQRGSNENANGLIREFFPKSSSFINVTAEELKYVQDLINERPKKVLDFHTPEELMRRARLGISLKLDE